MSTRCQRRRRSISLSRSVSDEATSITSPSVICPGRRRREGERSELMTKDPYSRSRPLAGGKAASAAAMPSQPSTAQEWRENGGGNGRGNGRADGRPGPPFARLRFAWDTDHGGRRAPRWPPRAKPGRAGAAHRAAAVRPSRRLESMQHFGGLDLARRARFHERASSLLNEHVQSPEDVIDELS